MMAAAARPARETRVPEAVQARGQPENSLNLATLNLNRACLYKFTDTFCL